MGVRDDHREQVHDEREIAHKSHAARVAFPLLSKSLLLMTESSSPPLSFPQVGLHGGQAEYVRVPLADGTLVRVPDDVTSVEALLIGDILSTGSVGGRGSVGLCPMRCLVCLC